MYTKSMLALGALAGAGILWIRRIYHYKKTREELKSEKDVIECGLESIPAAHSNVENGLPAITDHFMQHPSVGLPKGFLPLNEIKLSKRQRRMINKAIQKPSVNPLVLLNRIIPGIIYEHEIIQSTPVMIRVDATIYGRLFSAYGPTKKAAKLQISFMAMYLFYGYTQQDLEYKPSTSAAETNLDHDIPTNNTREEDILSRPSTSAEQTNINTTIPTTNTRRKYFIEKKVFYREKKI